MDFQVERGGRASKNAAITLLIVLSALTAGPYWLNAGHQSVLMEIFYFLALAQLWNLMAGFAGVVSLGQQAFVGIGGYTLFAAIAWWGIPPLVALALAGIVGLLVALPVVHMVFRLQGAYLAIGTWVVAEVLGLGVSQIESLGAGSGMSLPIEVADSIEIAFIDRDGVLYLGALFLLVTGNLCAYGLLRSRFGLALTAIRDNESAAAASGVDCKRVKLVVYLATALGTSLLGALIYLTKFRISPAAAFDINWTSYIIFIVVIGGVGTLEGPIVGTIVFFLLREYLADTGTWYLVILGLLSVAIMLKWPAGIWGSIAKRFDLKLFPTGRRLRVSDREL
ncbi:MAG: branched-chain amino acid ABC transporter permease [Proteobacteria bacterium]|nr:branched-chain amino acid ABC transporter permease [Pseudomonadota bacterium]